MQTDDLDQDVINKIIEQAYLFMGTTAGEWNYRIEKIKTMPMFANQWGNLGIGTTLFYDPKEAMDHALEAARSYSSNSDSYRLPLLLAVESAEYIGRLRKGRPVSGVIIKQPVFLNDIELVTDYEALLRVLRKMPQPVFNECYTVFNLQNFIRAKEVVVRTGITVFN